MERESHSERSEYLHHPPRESDQRMSHAIRYMVPSIHSGIGLLGRDGMEEQATSKCCRRDDDVQGNARASVTPWFDVIGSEHSCANLLNDETAEKGRWVTRVRAVIGCLQQSGHPATLAPRAVANLHLDSQHYSNFDLMTG